MAGALGIDDAVAQIEVANAIGMGVPAPRGTVVFQPVLTVWDDEQVTFDLGVYATREDAVAAVANWVVRECLNTNTGPWAAAMADRGDEQGYDQAVDTYLASVTDEVLIEAYMRSSGDAYEIGELTVSPGVRRYRSVSEVSWDR